MLRPALADSPAFAVDGAVYTWDDVARAAAAWSEWAAIERRAGEAVASVRRLEQSEEELPAAELERRERRFRLARRLLAADELRNWLERWVVTLDEWRTYLCGSLLRERGAGALAAASPAPPAAELESFVHVEAVCSGDLERAAEKLAGRAALFAREGHADKGDVRLLDEAYARFRAANVTPERLRREVDRHRLEWIRVDVEELGFAAAAPAREALVALREEGRELEAVARAAGTGPRRGRRVLGELDASLARALLGVAEGEVVGPFESGGEYIVLRVVSKLPPTLDDPAIRARAETALLGGALRREAANRVRWHERR